MTPIKYLILCMLTACTNTWAGWPDVHADPRWGVSVMMAQPFLPGLQARDVTAAACVLGCGVCENTDPYDKE